MFEDAEPLAHCVEFTQEPAPDDQRLSARVDAGQFVNLVEHAFDARRVCLDCCAQQRLFGSEVPVVQVVGVAVRERLAPTRWVRAYQRFADRLY